MPRYFFTVLDRGMSRDDIGTVCPDAYAAQAEAVRTSGQMLREIPESVCEGSDWRMEVTDDHDLVLFVVHILIEEALDLEVPTSPRN